MKITPIAFFRAGDVVAFWFDTPRGWALVDEAIRMPRAVLAASVVCAEPGLDSLWDPGVAVVPMLATSLPLCTPDEVFASCDARLRAMYGGGAVPVWDGPTSRAEEDAQFRDE